MLVYKRVSQRNAFQTVSFSSILLSNSVEQLHQKLTLPFCNLLYEIHKLAQNQIVDVQAHTHMHINIYGGPTHKAPVNVD